MNNIYFPGNYINIRNYVLVTVQTDGHNGDRNLCLTT